MVREVKPRAPLSPEDYALAKEMRRGGGSWLAIGKWLNCHADTIRSHLEPEFAEKLRAVARRRGRSIAEALGITREIMDQDRDTNEERNPIYDPRRDGPLGEPETLTALLLGDPLPRHHEFLRRLG